jgi:hypothetical protein
MRCPNCCAPCEETWETARGWVCPSCSLASEDNGLPALTAAEAAYFTARNALEGMVQA